MNFLEAKFDGENLTIPSLENFNIKKFPRLNKQSSKITIGVRPQDVILKKTNKGKKIELVENLGNLSFCHTKLSKDCFLISETNNKENLSPGDTIQVKLNENSLYFFEKNSGIRIR